MRENTTGQMGSFEAPVIVPELKQAPMKVSSVVLSTQLQTARRRARPTTRSCATASQLLPNLTHVVGRDQKLFFYYEVYDPGADERRDAQLRTSLAFYRGKVKVFETPVVERTSIDVAGSARGALPVRSARRSFTPGLYTCQINIVDAVAGKFDFPRMLFAVR